MIQLNFYKEISEINKILNMYSKFNLSSIGRINALKTLALPKLVYLFTVLPTHPKFLFDVIEKKFKNFFWNKSTVKCKNKPKTTQNGYFRRWIKTNKYTGFQ